MKKMELMMLVGAVAVAAAFARAGEPLSDDAMKERIVQFVTLPGRMCGRALVDFREEFRNRKLTNRTWFDGDTNRLARLIAELAQTNDVELSSQMVETLGEYGTVEQLPFLYSCATNPAIGNLAVRAAVRIEGITSNSVAILRDYLSFTNTVTRSQAYDRAQTSRYFLERLQGGSILPDVRNATFQVVQSFAADINTSNSIVDEALVAADGTYRHSKRRLAVLRAAYPRCFNEYQTNYVTNAINELVAYPEANLPD